MRLKLLAAFFAGALIVAGVLGFVVLDPGDGEALLVGDSAEMRSYHFRARITGLDQTARESAPALFFEGWYEAPHKTRWEIGQELGENREISGVFVTDGVYLYTYSPETNSYGLERLDVPNEGPLLFPTNFMIGPHSALDEFLADKTGWEPTRLGEATVLDRMTVVVEVFPWVSSSTFATDASGTSMMSRTGYGKGTFWFDAQFPFVMRLIVDLDGHDPARSFHAEVIEVEFNGELPEGIFDFEPPEGAQQADLDSRP